MKRVLTVILAVVAAILVIGILGAIFTPKKEATSETVEQNSNADFWASYIAETFTSDYSHAVADVKEDSVQVCVYIDDLALTVGTPEYNDFLMRVNDTTLGCRTATDNKVSFWIFAFDSDYLMQPVYVSFNGKDVTEDFTK